MYTRREFGMVTLAGLALPRLVGAGGIDSKVAGVRLGVQTYSFRDLPRTTPGPTGDAIDVVIKATTDAGLGEVELWASQIEPQFAAPGGGGGGGRRGGTPPTPEQVAAREKAREDLRKWRVETPVSHFENIKKKFDAAGIKVYGFNYSFNTGFSDAEIDRGFVIAKALGASIITASATLESARRVAPFADKHRMVVAMHNHANLTDPNEFATPASFEAAMKMSKYFKVNLDIGHFVAANFDPIAYLRQNHQHVTNLHLKDRKKDQGDNVPWGEGDTPIKEVLQLLKKEKWDIPGFIEYEYRGTSPVEEVRKAFDYAKQALA